jgi:hypothetical protein
MKFIAWSLSLAGLLVLLILARPAVLPSRATAQDGQEKRVALVIGDGAYRGAELPTAPA